MLQTGLVNSVSQDGNSDSEVRDEEVPIWHHDGAYFSSVRRMSHIMPHLVNAPYARPRFPSARSISYFQLAEERLDSSRSSGTCNSFTSFKAVPNLDGPKDNLSGDVRVRLALVEDLSPNLIELLGSAFQMNPEFFESHLYRSGYAPLTSKAEVNPALWNSSTQASDFATLRWHRPVQRLSTRPLYPKERDIIVNSDGNREFPLRWTVRNEVIETEISPGVSVIEEGRPAITNEYAAELETNIFRQDWPLNAQSDDVFSEQRYPLPAAWPETISVYFKRATPDLAFGKDAVCRYVVTANT